MKNYTILYIKQTGKYTKRIGRFSVRKPEFDGHHSSIIHYPIYRDKKNIGKITIYNNSPFAHSAVIVFFNTKNKVTYITESKSTDINYLFAKAVSLKS